MRFSLVAFITLMLTIRCLAQEYPEREYDLEKLAEAIFPIQDLDLDYSQLYENLAQILSNPIDLNKATAEQLRSLYILNEIQLTNLLLYQKENGPLLSVYELQSINGFDQNTLDKLIPFVTVKNDRQDLRSLAKRILNENNNYLLLRFNRTLETKRGYQTNTGSVNPYAGSPDRFYSRFRTARASDFSLGFTLEKDAGEAIKWSPTERYYGVDYTSYHAQFLNKGRINNLVLGDFQAQFGQGLILGGGFGGGKGAESITSVRRSNLGFLPYTSLNESGFFRGAALSVGLFKGFTLHTFASGVFRDGSTTADSLGLSLSSLPASGLHRTPTEVANRKILKENNLGSVVNYRIQSLEVGAIIQFTEFSIPIKRSSSRYNQFFFNGNENINTGIFLNYSFSNMSFFSEFAQSDGQGKAYTLGALTSLSPNFDMAIHYRHFDRNFQSFYGNAFSESTSIQNESGYYMGLKYKVNKQHNFSGYYDLFKFPWLKFRGYAPSTGHEWLLRYNFQPSKEILIFLQLREESKIRNHSDNTSLYTTSNGIKRNYWINMDYAVNLNLSFKSRVQFSTYEFEHQRTSGFTLTQDLNFKFRKFTISTRYALFDTDDFDNRQYVYEKDVWFAYSFPFYHGLGIRNYLLMKYELGKNIDAWIKWSRTRFEDRETIGSGNETIEGNTVNDIKLQVRIKL